MLPAAGFWLSTTPPWPLVVTAWGCTTAGNPATPSVCSALPRLSPTTLGTAIVGDALATTRSIVAPGFSEVPPTGDWLITVPGGAVVDTSSVVLTMKPPGEPSSWALAWLTVSLVTSGTRTGGGPVETKMVTCEFTAGFSPAAGVVWITRPDAIVPFDW